MPTGNSGGIYFDRGGTPRLVLWKDTSSTDIVYLENPSNNDIRFRHNNQAVTSMILKSNGRVGIGTSSPTDTLNIIGTFNVSNATGKLGLYQDSNRKVGINVDTIVAKDFQVGTFTTSGNISIGSAIIKDGVVDYQMNDPTFADIGLLVANTVDLTHILSNVTTAIFASGAGKGLAIRTSGDSFFGGDVEAGSGGVIGFTNTSTFSTGNLNYYTIGSTFFLQRASSNPMFKENIEDIKIEDTNKLLDLRVKKYQRIDTGQWEIGLLSTDVELINPDWVVYDIDGRKIGEKSTGIGNQTEGIFNQTIIPFSVNYQEISIATLSLVQEQQIEIENLESKNILMEESLCKLGEIIWC